MQIGEQGLRFSFLNVRPERHGRLEETLERWREAEGLPWLKTYRTLGAYDTIVVSPLEAFGDRPEIPPVHVGSEAADANGIYCYTIDDLPANDVLATLDKGIFLFCLLKVNTALQQELGIDAEDMIARFISQKKLSRGTTRAILGTLGWHELLLILTGTNIESMIRDVLLLRRDDAAAVDLALGLNGSTGLTQAGANQPILETSFTVAGVSENYAAEARAGRGTASRKPLHARITVVSRPNQMSSIVTGFAKAFKGNVDRRSPLGRGELVAGIYMSFDDLLSRLLAFKEEFAKAIQSTETALEVGIASGLTWEVNVPQFGMEAHTEPGPDLRPLRRHDFYTYSNVAQVFSSFNHNMAAEFGSEAFVDQHGFTKLLTEALQPGTQALTSEALVNACATFRYGVQQRFQGSYLSWTAPVVSRNIQLEGGVQRILGAVSASIGEVLETIGIEYKGFPVFGARNDPRWMALEVINLPLRSILWPGDWHLLIHEAGHGVTVLCDPTRDQELAVLFEKLQHEETDSASLVFEHRENILFYEELVADLFDFIVGCDESWDTYLRLAMFDFLVATAADDRQAERLSSQLYRLLFLKAVGMSKAERQVMLSSPDGVGQVWQGILDDIVSLRQTGIEVSLDGVVSNARTISRAWMWMVDWLSIHEYVYKTLKSAVIAKPLPIAPETVREIHAGRPARRVSSSFALLKELALHQGNGNAMSFSSRIAAILTLWSTFRMAAPLRQSYEYRFNAERR